MASKPPTPPDAFLSYTRFDDRRGDISAFRKHLEESVRELTGEPFEIFQDVDDIEIGWRWSDKLDEMLAEARFFIPILTPSYFKSDPCRDELQKFLNAEERAGRRDLILPIYYIKSPVLEDKELRRADALATTIHQRQRWDWRELRHYSLRHRNVRLEIAALGEAIAAARHTRMPQRAAPASRSGAADEAKHAQGVPVDAAPAPQARREAEGDSVAGRPRDEAAGRSGERPLPPGTVFRDKDEPWCPELVVIPPGEFTMGSTESSDEKPPHLVRIAYPLAVGRYPVTFGEYGHFARTTGRAQPGDEGWGRGRRPVINVDWEDAKSFIAWLSVQTGQRYRLLSEAEWEHACRAGSTTRYSWGDEITPENANYGTNVGETSEVGSYPTSSFGLYDMHGNVWEWIEDRWHDSYNGAPDDGSVWAAGGDLRRVLRGGSWDCGPEFLRSADRSWGGTIDRDNYVGFRVARALTAQPAVSPVKDTNRSKLEYHDPELTGRVTFNYSNNNGCYSIGQDEFLFETKWSKASDRSIHLYNDPPSIIGIAEAPELRSYMDLLNLDSYDISSRARTIHEGEHAILKNCHGKYAVLKILDIEDRTRSDTSDELTFEFWILTDTTKAEHKANGEKRRAATDIRERAEDAEAKRGAEEEGLRQADQTAEPRKTDKPLKPGTVFRDVDAPWCPEMAVIPPGEFMMGSTEVERARTDAEGPQHRVTFASPFALGKYPVTFEEYDHFCVRTGRDKPRDQGWNRGRRPVINVSWEGAQAYCEWLSEQAGEPYRLPSEAAWEYACRAGTTTPFWTGATISTDQANYACIHIYRPGYVGEDRKQTEPVEIFKANPWGLHDMHGNVWEWCEDCWNASYTGSPNDGSAWTSGDCPRRVIRGGSWDNRPEFLRSASRGAKPIDNRNDMVGFRVARTLSLSEGVTP